MSQPIATGGIGTITTAQMFGAVLRHLRQAAGYTQEELAAKIPCDRTLVTRVESATRVPQDTFVRKCDELLGTGTILIDLWSRVDWYPSVEHPDWFKRRAEMDARAVALYSYQAQVIPGLLQTPEYARVILSYAHQGNELEELLRARLSRQQRFLSPNGPFYHVVLDESCLRNSVGSPAVMRIQLDHLIGLGKLPNIRIQVAPANQEGLQRPDVSMSLIELPNGAKWIYSESLDRGHFINDPEPLARYVRTYDVLRADALSAPMSAAWISEALEGYRQHDEASPQGGNVAQEQLQRIKRRGLHRNRRRYPRLRPRG